MLRQQYRDVAHEGYISHDATYHVFFPVQKLLACGIELGVVRRVVLLHSAGVMDWERGNSHRLWLGVVVACHPRRRISVSLCDVTLAFKTGVCPGNLYLCTIGISLPLTLYTTISPI
jgi:hypothetical protein